MPRDLIAETKPLSILDRANLEPDHPDLGKPSLKGLRWLLLRPHLWKDHLIWNFRHYLLDMGGGKRCGCAMGLGYLTWGSLAWHQFQREEQTYDSHSKWAICFGETDGRPNKVTPTVVADRIKHHYHVD